MAIALLMTTAHGMAPQQFDVFGTRAQVSATPSAAMIGETECRPLPDGQPIDLADAILQALCASPQARGAWANARAQAAALGIADAAYLPQMSATAGIERDALSSSYDGSAFGDGAIRRSQNASSRYGSLSLNWVLFDFGKRAAARRQAGALLAAANATQSEVLESVMLDTAQAFYALADAQALLNAADRAENIARLSLEAARARHDAGAGTLGDELRARTSYQRSLLDRVSAQGDVQVADGALAVAMGRYANTPVRIAPASSDEDTDRETLAGVGQLIEEAKRRHPRLIAARAQVEAALAGADAARAQGRPTIALVGSLSQNNPSYQQQPQGLLSPRLSTSRGSTLGVQLTIPLFEGFASGYRVAQADAQADARLAALHDTELQVSLEVWKRYHEAETNAANLKNVRDLVDSAGRALKVAQGRYQEGVGTFSELLDTQVALADARRQRVQVESRWRSARLRLAASLGRLGRP
ncbi:TolC family protein [Burkholderia sp. 22PA0099]